MSISNIEIKIELLKEKLKEVDNTIIDPIEKNEYKRELQKKIKKLNQTKINLEKLEQEQQELESLKNELILNNKIEKIDKKQPEIKLNNQNNPSFLNLDINDALVVKKNENPIQTKQEIVDDFPTYLPITKNPSSSVDTYNNNFYVVNTDKSQISENSKQLTKTKNKAKTNHSIYLSKRAIWLSTIFAFLGFYLPYMYTRRWKPFFTLLSIMGLATIFVSEENILVTAPLISAIDNGIAISKSKNKAKNK